MEDNHFDDHVLSPFVPTADGGCAENRLRMSRRSVLGLTAALSAWAFLPKSAMADNDDPRMVIVVLHGGMDGLHLAHNTDETSTLQGYRSGIYGADYLSRYVEPQILVNGGKVGAGISLNPNVSKFKGMFEEGTASLVHGIAPPLRTRSHFDCMDSLETGASLTSGRLTTGWLNRLASALPAGEPIREKFLAVGNAPLILKGSAPVQSWGMASLATLGSNFQNAILSNYKSYGPSRLGPSYAMANDLQEQLSLGLDCNNIILSTPSKIVDARGEAVSDLRLAFRGAGRLLASPNGPRIAVLSIDGLDTHKDMIRLLDAKLADIDLALFDLARELGSTATGGRSAGSVWNNTIITCVTEFGRTVKDNSTGTDHGVGTAALLLGGAVNGGKVLGSAVDIKTLNEGRDLVAVNDTRALFKGILRDHLGFEAGDASEVFPQSGNVTPLENLVTSAARRRYMI